MKWPDWLEDIHTNDLSFRGYAMHEIMPVLTRNGIPLAICPEGQLVCSESGPVPPLYLKLAKDPEFRAILTVRRIMMWNSAQDLENARSEADKILALIRSQIDVTD